MHGVACATVTPPQGFLASLFSQLLHDHDRQANPRLLKPMGDNIWGLENVELAKVTLVTPLALSLPG